MKTMICSSYTDGASYMMMNLLLFLLVILDE
jgi:hypothetical protein